MMSTVDKVLNIVSSLSSVALESTFGDAARAVRSATAAGFAVAAVPTVGFALLCACVFAEALFPIKSGYLLGFLLGVGLGLIAWPLVGAIAYFPFAISSPGTKFVDFMRCHEAGAGPLLVAGFLGTVLHFGSVYYFHLPWYSASVFLILGVLWSAFSVLRLVASHSSGRVGLVFLSLYLPICVPIGLGYSLPLLGNNAVQVLQRWGYLKDVIVTW